MCNELKQHKAVAVVASAILTMLLSAGQISAEPWRYFAETSIPVDLLFHDHFRSYKADWDFKMYWLPEAKEWNVYHNMHTRGTFPNAQADVSLSASGQRIGAHKRADDFGRLRGYFDSAYNPGLTTFDTHPNDLELDVLPGGYMSMVSEHGRREMAVVATRIGKDNPLRLKRMYYEPNITFAYKLIPEGDVNHDGKVAFDDFITLSAHYGATANSGVQWDTGDLIPDGTINFADFIVLSKNYGRAVEVKAAAVPEPNGWWAAALLWIVSLLYIRWAAVNAPLE